MVTASLALTRLIHLRPRPYAIGAVHFALAMGDLVQAPLYLRDAPPASPAYHTLSRLPKAPLAEFLFWATSQDFHGHSAYMPGWTAL